MWLLPAVIFPDKHSDLGGISEGIQVYMYEVWNGEFLKLSLVSVRDCPALTKYFHEGDLHLQLRKSYRVQMVLLLGRCVIVIGYEAITIE
jgi:hypothetical protein